MAVDVAQCERSNIKCYASVLRIIQIYIYIDLLFDWNVNRALTFQIGFSQKIKN